VDDVYNADGISASTAFEFTSAIRGIPPYECPDEDDGEFKCGYTVWVECAMNGAQVNFGKTTTVAQKVKFLGCWDNSTSTVASRAKLCAGQSGLDYDAVRACRAGNESQQLLAVAANKFMTKWPSHASSDTAFQVPHMLVAGTDLDLPITYDAVMEQLCATGISATACTAFAAHV